MAITDRSSSEHDWLQIHPFATDKFDFGEEILVNKVVFVASRAELCLNVLVLSRPEAIKLEINRAN